MDTSPTVSTLALRESPENRPITGEIMSFTNESTIALKAPPMITPTARSITLPRAMNFLNSDTKFFMLFSFSPLCLPACSAQYVCKLLCAAHGLYLHIVHAIAGVPYRGVFAQCHGYVALIPCTISLSISSDASIYFFKVEITLLKSNSKIKSLLYSLH